MTHQIRYRAAEIHLARTVRGARELEGSVHHAELTEFTGLVTRSHADGGHDIVIFPPDKPPIHLHNVREGQGPGTLTFVAGGRLKPNMGIAAR